jgi:hypothetical protein
MKTRTSSLMDGKDYQQRKVMRIDDINAMADADIRVLARRLEQLNKSSNDLMLGHSETKKIPVLTEGKENE